MEVDREEESNIIQINKKVHFVGQQTSNLTGNRLLHNLFDSFTWQQQAMV